MWSTIPSPLDAILGAPKIGERYGLSGLSAPDGIGRPLQSGCTQTSPSCPGTRASSPRRFSVISAPQIAHVRGSSVIRQSYRAVRV